MKAIAITLIMELTLLVSQPPPVRAQSPTPTPAILFGKTEIIYELPDRYIFQMQVKTPSSLPNGGFISFYYDEDDRINRMIEIDHKNPRTLQFSINTDSFFIFPYIPLHFRWSVSDDHGNFEISPEESIIGEDPRYEWQKLESIPLSLTVYWHDRTNAFGEQIFTAAEQAAKKMEVKFGARPAEPITVLIYNSSDELVGYLDSFSEDVGGQAYSDLGLTIQIIKDDFFMDNWISDVIPHEISHLYFHQATGGEKVNMNFWPPAWLNEGLAQVNAYGIDKKKLEDISWEMQHSEWLPTLQYLSVNFGMNDGYSDIEYKMAYSVTCYLITEYGEDKVAAILKEYLNGAKTEEAFKTVLGVNFATLAGYWRVSSGLPAANTVPYPPTVTPTVPIGTPGPEELAEVGRGIVYGVATLGGCCILLSVFIIILILIFVRKKKGELQSNTAPSTE